MKQAARYFKVLNQLIRQLGLQIEVRLSGDTLIVNGIMFVSAGHKELSSEPDANKGFLLPSLTEDEKQFCQDHRINYLTLDGQFQLNRGGVILFIAHDKKTRSKVKQLKSNVRNWVSPTLLFSPYALSILDVLFRVSEKELTQASSVLAFSKVYGLYQPKLSKMMREFGAKDLVVLKSKISDLPEEWWLLAFQYPATKKRLTSFFEVAKAFHSLEVNPALEEDLNSVIVKAQGKLIPGPIEMPKKLGLIYDRDHYLWGTQAALQDLKRQYKLVPGKAIHASTWYLAVPARELHQESIASRIRHENFNATDLANPFRAVWDLSFGSERLKEVRVSLLRSLLK